MKKVREIWSRIWELNLVFIIAITSPIRFPRYRIRLSITRLITALNTLGQIPFKTKILSEKCTISKNLLFHDASNGKWDMTEGQFKPYVQGWIIYEFQHGSE